MLTSPLTPQPWDGRRVGQPARRRRRRLRPTPRRAGRHRVRERSAHYRAAPRRCAGAVARGETVLACECGAEDCPARADRDAAAAAVIHVLAEQATLDGTSVPGVSARIRRPARRRGARAGRHRHPATAELPHRAPEPAYRPSAGLALFLRWRDLSCCWPGCDTPVTRCDIDHTVAWPAGATHPANNKHYCRTHHLIKTFYAQLGWRDQQLPRRHRHPDQPHRAHLHQPTPRRHAVPRPGPTRRRPTPTTGHRTHRRRSQREDAAPHNNPSPKPRQTHRNRTPPTQRTHPQKHRNRVGEPPTSRHPHPSRDTTPAVLSQRSAEVSLPVAPLINCLLPTPTR